jgi:hypothetical protein
MPDDVAPDRPASYFVRVDEHRFLPTALTGGGWSVDEQHISPMNGLVIHEVERFVAARGGDGLQIGRICLDILGVLPLEAFDVEVEVVRPGRTIELLEVIVSSGGRAALRARVWRMAVADTSTAAGVGTSPLPDPDGLPLEDLTRTWPGGFIATLECRPTSEFAPGRRACWMTSDVPLLQDEPVSDLARYVGFVDTMNGVAVRRSPDEWMYPNLDLTIHLFRQPTGPWVGLDTSVDFGADGLGVTSAALHDVGGPVGRAAQTLTLRPRG